MVAEICKNCNEIFEGFKVFQDQGLNYCFECWKQRTGFNPKQAQEWWDQKYPNKVAVGEIREFESDRSSATLGDLVVADFPNLQKLELVFRRGLDCQIKNCPKLERLVIASNWIKNLSFLNCPKLETLIILDNGVDNVDLSGLPNLKFLDFRDNETENKLDISNNLKLEDFFVSAKQYTSTSIDIEKLIKKIQQKEQELKTKLQESKDELNNLKKEVIGYKLKGKERKLENFIQKLGVNREKVRDLSKAYQKLIKAQAQESFDPNVVMLMEDEVEKIKDELLSGGWFIWKVSLEDAQKLCHKCEVIAKLRIEQENFYQEQFEARQEVPL
jgi:hypothetical protein